MTRHVHLDIMEEKVKYFRPLRLNVQKDTIVLLSMTMEIVRTMKFKRMMVQHIAAVLVRIRIKTTSVMLDITEALGNMHPRAQQNALLDTIA